MAAPQNIPVIMDSKKSDHKVVLATIDADPRHTGKVSMAWADGHVTASPPTAISMPALTSEELLAKYVPIWTTYDSNPRYGFNTFVQPFNVTPPTGWTSNVYGDGYVTNNYWNTNSVMSGSVLFCGVNSPYANSSWYNGGNGGGDDYKWWRIPLNTRTPGSPAVISQSWVFSLPYFNLWESFGRYNAAKDANTTGLGVGYVVGPAQLHGYVSISILDDT